MKQVWFFLTVLLGATLLVASEKEQRFQDEFVRAVNESDKALLKLVKFSDQTPKVFREIIRKSLKEERSKKRKAMSFLDPAPDTVFEFEYEGVTYTTTLPVVKEFKITYDMTDDTSGVDGTTYRLGLENGQYRIVAPTPKKQWKK